MLAILSPWPHHLPINYCETQATLCTCFVLGLAGEVRSQFDWGDLPMTLAGAICLALDFEASGASSFAVGGTQGIRPGEVGPHRRGSHTPV